MATIYRAYANGEEITSFPVNGVETEEIWGGDTLLWKKENASSTTFELTVSDGLTYFVPPSSFYIAIKQIVLASYDIEVPLNSSNIEFGFWGEDVITESGSTKRVSSYAFLLCKAKTEEVKKNIDKIFFYTLDFDGKEGDFPIGGPSANPEVYQKVNSRIIYGDNVFSLETYNIESGIRFFNLRNFNTSIGGYNPNIGSSITGTGNSIPTLHQFDSKEELLSWAIS